MNSPLSRQPQYATDIAVRSGTVLKWANYVKVRPRKLKRRAKKSTTNFHIFQTSEFYLGSAALRPHTLIDTHVHTHVI